MTQSAFTPAVPAFAIGQVVPMHGLSGRWEKYLVLPADRQGVLVLPGQPAQMLPGGQRHRVLTFGERLLGGGGRRTVAWLMSAPFKRVLETAYLPTADGQLVDASALVTLTVRQPELVLGNLAGPERWILPNLPGEADLRPAWSRITRGFAASDLSGGVLPERLAPRLAAELNALVSANGLVVAAVDLLVFWPSSERVEVEEQRQIIERRLAQKRQDQKMAELEDEANLAEFTRQLFPETSGVSMSTPAAPATPPPTPPVPVTADQPAGGTAVVVVAAPAAPQPGEVLAEWCMYSNSKFVPIQQHALAKPGAQQQKKRVASTAGSRNRRKYIIQGIISILSLAAGFIVNQVILATSNGPTEQLSLQIPVWTTVVTIMLKSISVVYQVWEDQAAEEVSPSTPTILDDLASDDRAKVDGLVRQQANRELQHMQEILHEIRRRVYQAGRNDLSLAFGQQEKWVEVLAGRVLDLAYAQPPYIGTNVVSRELWWRFLDAEENLLLFLNSISDQAQALRQLPLPALGLADLESVAAGLREFEHRFAIRSRAIRGPESAA